MPEYKSRINIKIEKICDWDKLLDIKIKEEWKLDKSAEDIFREAYYRGGFIKAGDWSVDPESLEDMVEYFAKTIGHENCVIMADVLEQNAENPSCNSFLALGNQNIVCVSYLNCDKLNGTNIFDIYFSRFSYNASHWRHTILYRVARTVSMSILENDALKVLVFLHSS